MASTWLVAAAGAAALFSTVPLFAQDTAPPPVMSEAPAPTASCELHVWPGRGFHSVYYGWAHGGTIDGGAKGRKGYPQIPDEPLSPAVQLRELAKLDIAGILGLTGTRVVLHEQPLTSTAIRSTPGRQLSESPPCYSELMIDDIVFQNNVINGKWLNVIFRFRQFDGSGPAPVRSYGTYVLQRAKLFPPDVDTDPQPALDELTGTYAQSVNEFGKQYAAYLKRNGKKKGASITL